MSTTQASHLVSTDWLAENMDNPDLKIVDSSFYLPTEGKDPRVLFEAEHIPGAVFFDIDAIADQNTDLPHMVPSAADFADMTAALGLGSNHTIVVYDQRGVFSSPRCWWMFRLFGHRDVKVLDGGLPKWKAEARDVTSTPTEQAEASEKLERLVGDMDRSMIASRADVMDVLGKETHQIFDARPAGRFNGTAPEPRAELRSGHMPGSRNIPSSEMISENGTFKNRDAIQAVFSQQGFDTGKPVITSCGSGVTAAILALGLSEIGHEKVAVYDGSWSEWGLPGETPVVKDDDKP